MNHNLMQRYYFNLPLKKQRFHTNRRCEPRNRPWVWLIRNTVRWQSREYRRASLHSLLLYSSRGEVFRGWSKQDRIQSRMVRTRCLSLETLMFLSLNQLTWKTWIWQCVKNSTWDEVNSRDNRSDDEIWMARYFYVPALVPLGLEKELLFVGRVEPCWSRSVPLSLLLT